MIRPRVVMQVPLLLLVACGASGSRFDMARTLAELDQEAARPFVAELSEAEQARYRSRDIEALRAQIDAAYASPDAPYPNEDALPAILALELDATNACDLACYRRLCFVYTRLALLRVAGYSASAASSWGGASASDTHSEALIDIMMSRAVPRQRWAAGHVLHLTRDAAIVSATLQSLGRVEARAGHLAQARAYFEGALATQPIASLHDDLARACYRMDDLACGDRELAAMAAGADMTAVERERDAARIVQQPEPVDLDALLGRGTALLRLERFSDANALLLRLTRAFPDDARPWVMLAQLAFPRLGGDLDRASFDRISGHLAQAAHLSHRELAYYGMAALLWELRMARITRPAVGSEAAASALAALQEIVTGMSELDPGTAAAVDAQGRLTLSVLGDPGGDHRAQGTRALQDVLAARQLYPDNGLLRRLVPVLAVFATPEAGRAALAQPLEGEEALRSIAQFSIAEQADDPALLPAEPPTPELAAFSLAMRARHGLADWRDVAAAYRAAEGEADAGDRIADGVAVAEWRAGDHAGASAVFAQLQSDAGRLNALVTTAPSQRGADWQDQLSALRRSGSRGVACAAAVALAEAGALGDADRQASCRPPYPQLGASCERTASFNFVYNRERGFDTLVQIALNCSLLAVP